MTKQLLRDTIINLLDDENGINDKARDGIIQFCVDNEWHDIINAIETQNGRCYIGEDDADELREIPVRE